jgi:shikimate kinase
MRVGGWASETSCDARLPSVMADGMHATRHIRNLALAGFMGVGKSTVGRMVCEQLGFEFVDTDERIEREAGRSIREIFADHGEEVFRSMERKLVQSLADREGLVISTGGGLIVDPESLASLQRHALVVCLWASTETIYERVRHMTHRPLLQTPDPLARIRELLAAREPAYRQADVLIGVETRSAREVAQHVVHQFNLMRHVAK